jgi:hypothetical protein
VGFLGTVWTVLLAASATWALNWRWGVATFVLLPLIAAGAAIVAERRRLSWLAVQRFFVRHLHRRRLGRMRARQIAIARHLDELLEIGLQ